LKYAAGTDKGLIRETNEDSCNIIRDSRNDIYAFIIADGMGGHNCGEIASGTAVEYISAYFEDHAGDFLSAADRGAALKELVQDANSQVWEKSLESPETNGMGTTLTMAVVAGNTATVAHVGDSRLYLVREGRLQQVTNDHSYIEELVRKGTLTREEADNHPGRNIITRAIGSSPELEVDIFSLTMLINDILVLCTDGLTNMVGEDEIGETAQSNDPEAACKQLIEAANRNGGEDNVTVIVIKCE
jgi:protein phosphatase